MAVRGGELIFWLIALGALALLVLAFSAWLATRSRRPAPKKPPRRTFEHGRRLARMRRVVTTGAALDALRTSPVGHVEAARADQRLAEVSIERKRGQPCSQAAGFVAGLFESAWAHEVRVMHPSCAGEAGGVCRYVVERATGSGARGAAASIPGSEGERRRSSQARPGGG